MKNQDSNKSMIPRKSKFVKAVRTSELGKMILDIDLECLWIIKKIFDNFISSVPHEKKVLHYHKEIMIARKSKAASDGTMLKNMRFTNDSKNVCAYLQ